MAGIDLYGGDAGQIRGAYRSNLRRDASDDEVSGWLSGAYGGGGLNDWINQISNSGEAQQYKPPSTPAPSAPPVIGQNPNVSRPQDTPDPWAQARQGLENTYLQFTGRAAGPGDADKWLSGGFGYGSGLGDYDKFVNAIMGSPEARAYRPPAPTGNYQSQEYWQSQGVPGTDLFDPMTGQLRPGWSRTAKGYERTGAPTGGGSGDVQAWLKSVLTGASSPQALAALEPELNKRGIKLQKDSDGVIRGRLYLPDGSAVDLVSNGGWGQPWTWIERGKGGGDSGGGGGGRVGGGLPSFTMPGNQYSDPYTKLLEEMMQGRIGQLQQGSDPGYQQLMSYLQQRFAELQTPGRTGAENEVIRTGALDPIEQDRSAAKKRVMERLSARGLNLESGIAQQALNDVDKAFDAMRGTTQTALTMDELNRREGRSQYAENLAGQLYGIPGARSREALGYAGALSDLGPQRLRLAMEAAGMGGNPSSMFSNLMQLANMNQNAELYGAQNQQSLWSGLGSIAAILANSGR